jgi:hypothetical protein
MKNASSGILHRVALVRTDISEEFITSIFREARIGDRETKLAVTSNRRTLRRNIILDDGGYNFLRIVGSYNSHTA